MELNNFKGIFSIIYDQEYSVPILVDYIVKSINPNQFESFNYGASWDDAVEDPCNYCGDEGAGKGHVYYFNTIDSDDPVYSLIPDEVYEDIEDYIYVCMCGNCKSWWIHVK